MKVIRWYRHLHTSCLQWCSSCKLNIQRQACESAATWQVLQNFHMEEYHSFNRASCSSYPCNAISRETSKSWFNGGNRACCPVLGWTMIISFALENQSKRSCHPLTMTCKTRQENSVPLQSQWQHFASWNQKRGDKRITYYLSRHKLACRYGIKFYSHQ